MPVIQLNPVTSMVNEPDHFPPVDPCGRVVDWVRSCYRTAMAFRADGKCVHLVQWHFAEKTALSLPFPTAFCSRNWAEPQPYPLLGEVWLYPRPWANGGFPLTLAGDGHFCGDQNVWEDGVTGDCPPGLPALIDGVPVCCGGPIGPLSLVLLPGST